MPRYNVPYIYDPITQTSGTRKFVEQFIAEYGTYAERLEGSSEASAPLYAQKSKNGLKNYIGRASKVASTKSPFDLLSCFRMDLARIAKQLDRETRTVLGLTCMGFTPVEISSKINISSSDVKDVAERGISLIASILDGTHVIS